MNNTNGHGNHSDGQALERRSSASVAAFSGSSREPSEITERLETAMAQGHLVSPFTQCPTLPEGTEVAFSVVSVDSEVDNYGNPIRPGEIYKIAAGQYGVSKTPLNKIKVARGVVWDPHISRRLDNQSNPHYQRYYAFGYYQNFDGSYATIEGEKEIDLREGSALCKKIINSKISKALSKLPKDAARERRVAAELAARAAADEDINEARINITSNCQTKAELRAIRSMGIKTSYTLEELQKPFIVTTIVWTGRTNDPELRVPFAMKTADHFLGARNALFGHQAPPPQQLVAAPPPPLGATRADDDDLADVTSFVEAEEIHGEEPEAQTAQQQTRQPAEESGDDPNPEPPREPEQKTESSQASAAQPRHEEEFKLPNYGDKRGLYLDDSDVTVGDLNYYLRGVTQSIDNPEKSQYKRKNVALMEAIQRELARRGSGPATQASQQTAGKQKAMRF
jgi:hypothetical protein